MSPMLLFCLGIGKDIVNENNYEVVKKRFTHAVYQVYEHGRCVGQTKRHDHDSQYTFEMIHLSS